MDLNSVPTFDDFSNFDLASDDLDAKNLNTKLSPKEDNIPTFEDFEEIAKPKKLKKAVNIKKSLIPQASASQGGFVASGYGLRTPPKKGASSFHQGIDINAQEGMDVSPADEGEVIFVGKDSGKGLSVRIKHPDGRITEYNHLSKSQVEVGDRVKPEAIIGNVGHTGIATGPHLDFRVIDAKGNYVNPINELELDPKVNGLKLKLKQIPTFDEALVQQNAPTFEEFSQTPEAQAIEQQAAQPTQQAEEQTQPVNVNQNKTLEERASIGAVQKFGSKPVITVKNPHELVSDQVSVTINAPTVNAIDRNKATDQWLNAIDPNYGRLNAEYRSVSGRNLVDFEVPTDQPLFKPLGNNQYQLTSRLQAGAKEVINAYISGRNKGGPEAGWEAAYFKSQEIKREHKAVVDQVNNYYANEADNYAKQHPYLASVVSGINTTSPVPLKTEDIGSGIASILQGNAQLLHNLRTLPNAIYLLERYGGDSKEYQDAMEKDEDIQRTLSKSQAENYQPKDIKGQITKGVVEGLGFLPKAWATAPLGPAGLPLLVYAENIHRGNREAVKAALPMALMVGSTHGFSDFLTQGNKVYSTILDKEGNPQSVYEIQGSGLGNKAPFVRLPKELSSESNEAFLSGEPVSIGSLTPLQRQLIMRGSNALFSAVPTALEGGDLKQVATNLVVGLTFPVGKYKAGTFNEGKLSESPVTNSPSPDQIEQGRIDVPLDKWKLIAEQQQGNLPGSETGFQAFTSPATLRLDIDTAALNLLDMKRALKDKSIVSQGLGLKESMKRFADLQVAIQVLEQQIPKPALDFFEKNEQLIRGSLKTNWEAVKAKEEYLGKQQTQEIKTPDEIKENPNIDLKENPITRLQRGLNAIKGKENNKELVNSVTADVFGNSGTSNKWITPDRALLAYEGLLGQKGKDGIEFRRSGLTLDDMKASGKAIWNLTQIAAFHLEDFYHRGIKPSVDELANRFRLTLGDVVKNLQDKDFTELFNKGQDYLNSNIADPFFSRLKQDALEKLPNKFDVDQARNILSQHKDEFEWTAGLQDFLNENEGKRISKNDLIDIIQRGQVRVEAKIAAEDDARAEEINNILSVLVEKRRLTNDPDGKITAQIAALNKERDELGKVRYSLRAYSGEKLELPGSVNSKEVKLITPLSDPNINVELNPKFTDYQSHEYKYILTDKEGKVLGAGDTEDMARQDYFENKNGLIEKYKATHWNEPNIVAHYRANDRTTVDNIPTYFSEEFQSDWNHDIREKGLRIDPNKAREEIKTLGQEQNEINVKIDTSIKEAQALADKVNYDWSNPDKPKWIEEYNKGEEYRGTLYDRNREINERIVKLHEEIAYGQNKVEPNPFMQHSWKELVMKRFIRDAVTAKNPDYNPNLRIVPALPPNEKMFKIIDYSSPLPVKDAEGAFHSREAAQEYITKKGWDREYKYEGLGWTTARQQMERYGKILEGKHFDWKKNSDGTYTFGLNTEPYLVGETHAGTQYPHELDHITLERFAELTTKEAAEEVRNQEAESAEQFWTQRDIRRLKTLRKYLEGVDRQSYVHRELFAERDKLIEKEDSFKNKTPRVASGKFSLKEAVELRGSKDEKYNDYDVALVNIAKKIGKRFGAKYSTKEIVAPNYEIVHEPSFVSENPNEVNNWFIKTTATNRYGAIDRMGGFSSREEAQRYAETKKELKGSEQVHFLEITPSMRESLSKEGLPLYGLGGSEKLNNPEQGIRNKVVSADAFNQARQDLVNKLTDFATQGQKDLAGKIEEDLSSQLSEYELKVVREHFKNASDADKVFGLLNVRRQLDAGVKPEELRFRSYEPNKGTVFNSGLNPDAFIDQVKLLYQGYKDLASFTNDLVKRYGEPIRQFAEDLWFSIKNKAAEFNDKVDIAITNWQDRLNKVADDPAWQIRQGEQGRFSLRKDKSPELEEYLSDPTKHQSQFDLRYGLRGIALAQLNTQFGKVYDSMRIAQRVVNNYQSNIIAQLKLSRRLLKAGLDKDVAEAIYKGNETQKTFTDTELAARGLNPDQIDAYKNVRAAVDNVLNLRLETKLYAARAKAEKLNAKLQTLTQGTPEYNELGAKLLDLGDSMQKMVDYYQKLKDEGYISLQRRGKIAAFIEDQSQPLTITKTLQNGKTITIDNPDRKIYNHFDTKEEADKWMQEQKAALGIPKATLAGNIYDIRSDISSLKGIAIREKLTPSQFEDLVDRAGVNSNDPIIEKIRDEVYSKYPSFTYELDREYVRGYDRTYKNVVDSVVHQADLYGSSFYSKVGGEEALKALEQTGLEKSDPNLYKISLKYIQDEITSANTSFVSRTASKARRLVYLWQLGYDINQLYLNAVAQPITQTYGYFSRLNYEGKRLTGLEPEQYFLRGGKLAQDSILNKAPQEFADIVTQLTNEHVLAPEFTRSLIESESSPTGKLLEEGKSKLKKAVGEHWASVFMRYGEKLTRTHAAAEAYLVGKEKFNLQGDDLIKFMVRAVDATQSNPTRGENPYFVRSLGEGGKLVYQFMAFNQMWWENLALGVKQTKGLQRAGFLARETVPLVIMGGLRGLPLSAFALTLYSILTGRDPRKDVRNVLHTTKDSMMEALVNYGVTGSAALSQKLTPSAPILDQAGQALTTDKTNISDLAANIPAVSTGEQLQQGFRDLLKGRKLKALEGLTPRFIKGPLKSIELEKYGQKDRAGNTVESKRKVTPLQIAGQAINITPNPVIEHYEKGRTEKLRHLRPVRSIKRLTRKLVRI